MAKPNTKRRRCSFESLENRQMMAGDVSVRLFNGTLNITGDRLDNAITITAGINPFQVVITGVTAGGAPTGINGTPNGVVTLDNFTNNLNIDMGAGNDVVLATSGTVRGTATVSGGAGNDSITYRMPSLGNVKVNGGGGADLINTSNVAINGALNIKAGTGNDSVAIASLTASSIKTTLGSRNDTLGVSGTTTAKTTLNGNTGVNKLTVGTANFLFNPRFKNFV